jgi:hypothetical protein
MGTADKKYGVRGLQKVSEVPIDGPVLVRGGPGLAGGGVVLASGGAGGGPFVGG